MKVVTLIGSSTQKEEFEEQIKRLVSEGFCPLSISIYLGAESKNYNEENEFKEKLRLVHFRRIELADMVGIIRKSDGGIGVDTLKELLYAHKIGKEVRNVNEIIGDNK